jgi:hypothetical protein
MCGLLESLKYLTLCEDDKKKINMIRELSNDRYYNDLTREKLFIEIIESNKLILFTECVKQNYYISDSIYLKLLSNVETYFKQINYLFKIGELSHSIVIKLCFQLQVPIENCIYIIEHC